MRAMVDWNDEKRITRVAIVIAALLAFYQFWLRDLTYFDEPRYAEIAREMSDARSYAIPLIFGGRYTEKPPLYFWLALLSGRAFGFSSFAYFLPNVVSHFLTALLVLDLGKRFLASGAGALAAIGFAACPLSHHFARSAQLDALLTFGITLCAYGGIRAVAERRFSCGLLASLGFAIASLVKGHIALFGLLGPLAWCYTHRDASFLKRPRFALLFALLGIAPFAAWFYFVVQELGWDETMAMYLKRQVVERTAGSSHYSPWPVSTDYLGSLAAMLPLTAFLPFALRRGQLSANAKTFFLWGVVFFSVLALVPSKREIYMLPLAPPLSLVVGDHLARILRKERAMARGEATAASVLAAIFALACVALPSFVSWQLRGEVGFGGVDIALLLVLGGAASWAAFVSARERAESLPANLLLQVAVFLIFAEPLIARVTNANFGWPALASVAQKAIRSDETVIVLGISKPHAARFFLERNISFADEIDDLLPQLEKGKRSFVLTREKGARQLKREDSLVVTKIGDTGDGFADSSLLYSVALK